LDQIVQIAGALAVLAAFILAQVGRLDDHSIAYLVLNFAGSAAMAAVAGVTSQWGFLLLEGTWAIVSGLSLARVLRTPSVVDRGSTRVL
jgi:hypothetical protein